MPDRDDRRSSSGGTGPLAFAWRAIVFLVLMEGVSLCINLLQLTLIAPLRPLHSHATYRRVASISMVAFASLLATLTPLLCPLEIVVRGDVSAWRDRSAVVIANHQTYMDWWYLWMVAKRRGRGGHLKIILKEELKWIPIVGWGMQFFEFIFLSRKLQTDADRLRAACRTMRDLALPYLLILFPEGTILDADTQERSDAHAKKIGLSDDENTKLLLLPRATGLRLCLRELSADGASDSGRAASPGRVTDVTMGYEKSEFYPNESYPTRRYGMIDSLFGGRYPRRLHLHMRTISLGEMPLEDSAEFEVWLRRRWKEKERLLEEFERDGKFPGDVVDRFRVEPSVGDVAMLVGTVVGAWLVYTGLRWVISGVIQLVV